MPPSNAKPSSLEEQTRWFTQEVHPHDAALKAYLRARYRFSHATDVEDVVQESYVKIWKARATRPIKSVKAFLFRVAQNVALDSFRRNRSALEVRLGNFSACDVIDEVADVAEIVSTHEKERLLADAIAMLPSRAHDVVVLCKIKGLSHRAAAVALGIAEKTVDEHLRRGIKRLGKELRKRGFDRLYEA